MIQVNTKNISAFVPQDYFPALEADLTRAQGWLQDATGAGGDFVGWVHLPRDYDREEFARIQAAAKRIQEQSTALVVIGIGGSYLGARGVIEALCSPNYNQKKKNTPNIYFAGNTLSADALHEIVELLVETVCAKRKTTRIAGADFPHEVVRSRFLKLDSSHIEFVMDCLQKNTTEVRNMKQYLLTVLFNAPTTMSNHYTSQVNHDMYGGF